MNPIALTRQLIDIESTTGHEGAVAEFLARHLESLDYAVERMQVEEGRFNLYARPREVEVPALVFSTHTDTVPPFLPSREDDDNIYGRGACDAKGIIAAQVAACEELRKSGKSAGLLFVVGEERDSTGATVANQNPRGSRFLVNGEPTDNRIALASKGALRVEVTAHGKMAHSAYPELGESAIEKLLDSLAALRAMQLPENPEIGPSTMNIGIIEGGRATNVIPDFAKAQLLYRLVGPSEKLREEIAAAVGTLAEVAFVLDIAYMRFLIVPGIPTMTASFTTDIPKLSHWGRPVLLGPGSILVAHTEREFLAKRELMEAVELYVKIGTHLLG
ncbi:MAG: M20/M25/M40 family metallo-hydrolase [Acidobacteriota bacterium]|nr:M20/M25/M40 family metallo-hydrolase [Acidobacteriota bacterium]